MLRAYVDESEDGDVLVLSGGIATPAAWASASNDWDEALKFGVRLNWFKFAEATSLCGEFSSVSEQSRDEKIGHLRAVIYDHKIPQVSAFLPLRAFDRVFKHPFVPKDFRNPYVWLLYALVGQLAQAQEQVLVPLPKEQIDFFFDRRDIERDKIWRAWDTLKNAAWANHLIGQEPQFLDDKITQPLQMADLAAGLARNYWRESALGEKFPWDFPEYRRTHVPYITVTWTEERLRARLDELIAAYKKPAFSFTFDRWTYLKGLKE